MATFFSIALAILGVCVRGYLTQGYAAAGAPGTAFCPCIVPVVGGPVGYAYSPDGAQVLHSDMYGLTAAQTARRQNTNAQSGISQRRQNMNAQSGISQRRQNMNVQSDVSQGYGPESEIFEVEEPSVAVPESVASFVEPAVAVAEPIGAYGIPDGGIGQIFTSNFLGGLSAAQVGRRQNMNSQSQISQRRQNLNVQNDVNQGGY